MVFRLEPLKLTIAFDAKLLPLTVKVKPADPTAIDEGEIFETNGTGFWFEVTVKVAELEVPPPGPELTTVI